MSEPNPAAIQPAMIPKQNAAAKRSIERDVLCNDLHAKKPSTPKRRATIENGSQRYALYPIDRKTDPPNAENT